MSNLCNYVTEAFDKWSENNADQFEEGREYTFVKLINEAKEAAAVNAGYLFTRALDLYNIDPDTPGSVWENIIKEAEPSANDKWTWVNQLQSQGDILVTQDMVRATREACEFANVNDLASLGEEDMMGAIKDYLLNSWDLPIANGVVQIMSLKKTVSKLQDTGPTAQVLGNIACDLDVESTKQEEPNGE